MASCTPTVSARLALNSVALLRSRTHRRQFGGLRRRVRAQRGVVLLQRVDAALHDDAPDEGRCEARRRARRRRPATIARSARRGWPMSVRTAADAMTRALSAGLLAVSGTVSASAVVASARASSTRRGAVRAVERRAPRAPALRRRRGRRSRRRRCRRVRRGSPSASVLRVPRAALLERSPHLLHAQPDPRLDGAQRLSQLVRDLLLRQPAEVGEL